MRNSNPEAEHDRERLLRRQDVNAEKPRREVEHEEKSDDDGVGGE